MTLVAAPQGIDVRAIGVNGQPCIVVRVSLKTAAGADQTAAGVTAGGGSIVLRILQVGVQNASPYTPSFWTYDFGAALGSRFKTTAAGTETLAMVNQLNANGTNTGIWMVSVPISTDFVAGGVYVFKVTDSGGSATTFPISQEREVQVGNDQGDLTATNGLLNINPPASLANAISGNQFAAEWENMYPNGILVSGTGTAADGTVMTMNPVWGLCNGYPVWSNNWVNPMAMWVTSDGYLVLAKNLYSGLYSDTAAQVGTAIPSGSWVGQLLNNLYGIIGNYTPLGGTTTTTAVLSAAPPPGPSDASIKADVQSALAVDGFSGQSILEAIFDALTGVSSVNLSNPSAPVITFYKSDGVTPKLSVTLGTGGNGGVRTARSILN